MEKISVRVDDQLKDQMERHPEINWSEVTRQAIREKAAALDRLERMDELAGMSEATQDDVDEISELVDSGLAQRHVAQDNEQTQG